jgi:hypothetical protein
MTFAAILQDLYRRHRYQETPAPAIQKRFRAFVNETHRELLALPGLSRLRDDTIPLTATANLSRTGLPPSVARINGIVDRGNNHKLRQVPLVEFRLNDPAQAFIGGPPLEYAVVGNQAVQRQPATTGLWAVSSVSGDTTQNVLVDTLTTGGYGSTTAIGGTLLTGTTRVALGTRTDHIDVRSFGLDTQATGYVSLYDAATNGNELARLEPGKTVARYSAVEWYPIQTVDTTLYADVTLYVADLVNDTDEPLLPPDLHYVVGLGARVKEYEMLDDSRGAQARADYMRGQMALRSWVMNNGDRIASLRPTALRWSQLGAQFPAGS